MKAKNKNEQTILAEKYADGKVPLLEDYHEWKKYKDAFLDGWIARNDTVLSVSKSMFDALDFPQ